MEENVRFPTARKLLKEKNIEWDSESLKELPEWLRKAYLKDIDYCEHFNCQNKKLHIHRMKRSWEGGLYRPDNVKVICLAHHFLYHSNEFNHIKAK